MLPIQSASPKRRRRERMYREYMEFFDQGERTRRWHPLNDVPWDWLEQPAITQQIRNGEGPAAQENAAICLETFCGVELFIPDYTRNGLNLSREIFGQAWFHLAWGYEESKHALTFREYLLRSGLRTLDQYMDYEEKVLETVWELPFNTNREMACYGALQEIATYLIYAAQREKYKKEENPVLNQIFNLIGRDEAAHTSFYRKFLQFEFEEDPDGAAEDLAHVTAHFEMPGTKLIPDFYRRLDTEGVGVSSEHFMLHGIMPTLKFYGMTRREMLKALQRRREREARSAAAKLHYEQMVDTRRSDITPAPCL